MSTDMTPPVQGLQDRLATAFTGGPLLTVAPDSLAEALRQGGLDGFAGASPLAACLLHLLPQIGWRGSEHDIAEALPHFVSQLDPTDAINVLARLGLRPLALEGGLERLPSALLPALLTTPDGRAFCIRERQADGTWLAFNGATSALETLDAEAARGVIVVLDRRADIERPELVLPETWVGRLAFRFRGRLGLLLAQSAVINLCSLVVPLIVMAVYDTIIPSRNFGSLGMLIFGAVCLLGLQGVLQLLRTQVIAHIGGRIEAIVGASTFGQILNLPTQMVEPVPVGQQAARIREFDSMRDIFSGPTLSIALEFPFLILYFAAIWWIGGPLAWIPVAMVALYAAIGASLWPVLKRAVRATSKVRARRHSALIDLLTKLRAVKQLAAEDHWRRKMRTLAANAAHGQMRTADVSALVQNFAQAIMTLAGIATLCFGVIRVIDEAMTVGALIAVMALVWRVLSPLQSMFITLSRVEQMGLTMTQVNQLMRLQTEFSEPLKPRRVHRRLAGAIDFQRVSFRYAQAPDPSLLGVTMRVMPGELVAVVGGNGAGKSTILSLVLGLQRPQAGQILLDGADLRQVNPLELRRSIGYVPQRQSFFYGTIAQNLRLSNPTASDADLRAACARVGILERVEQLPEGFDTRIGDQNIAFHNLGFLQGLSIARALVRNSAILLLDEPAQGLDNDGDRMLVNLLGQLRGKVTVIMVTHRPSHIRLADKVAVLERGQLLAFGPPGEVLRDQGKGVA